MIRVERVDRVVNLVVDAPPVNVFDMAVLHDEAGDPRIFEGSNEDLREPSDRPFDGGSQE